MSPPIIREITHGGRTFKALVNIARNGHIYILEPTPEGPIKFVDAWSYVYTNVVTSIDKETGRFTYDKAHWPGTGKKAQFCPSLWGGKDWPYSAYNPDTGLMYIPANENICSSLEGAQEDYVPGELYIGVPIPVILGGFSLREGWEHIGEIQAWDVGNKKEEWTKTFKYQNWGPILQRAVTCSSPAVPTTGCSAHSTPRPATRCGSTRPTPALPRRRAPSRSTASSTSPCSPAGAWTQSASRMCSATSSRLHRARAAGWRHLGVCTA